MIEKVTHVPIVVSDQEKALHLYTEVLGMKKYPKDYIAACRARVDADLRAYRDGVGKAATKELEARFFNDQVLLLDYMFVHRLTGIEGKDGNPLNEVRVLCNSILLNRGRLQVDKLPGC